MGGGGVAVPLRVRSCAIPSLGVLNHRLLLAAKNASELTALANLIMNFTVNESFIELLISKLLTS